MDRLQNVTVPENVEIAYRVVGKTHVFSSKAITGLLHVGSTDREKAFNQVIPALNHHISQTYGCEAAYKYTIGYEEFCKHIDAENDILGNFINVTLEKALESCH